FSRTPERHLYRTVIFVWMQQQYLDLLEYLPEKIVTDSGKEYPLNVTFDEEHIMVNYHLEAIAPSGIGFQEHSYTLLRYIAQTEETFEVFGLLQAEMGKTPNGNLSFPNHESCIITKVMRWFAEVFNLSNDTWRWSVKLNINEPTDQAYKEQVETKVINHWIQRTKISPEKAYPKKVTYVNENYTKNKILSFYDYGTLVLEYKNKLFSDIIKHFVKKITYEKILTFDKELIRGFMRGIIAGEGCVDFWKRDKRYRVYISVTKEEEKEIYYQCLRLLNIDSNKYPGTNLVISKRHNNVQLLKQQLLTLSHEKYAKFCAMMKQYQNIREETGYFQPKGVLVPNRIPQEKINKIVDLYNMGVTRTVAIAEQLGISVIKVNRILKANDLGRRRVNTPELFRKEIADFAKQHLTMTHKELAEHFHIHESVINRICLKYQVKKGNKSLCTIPEEKIQRIIQLYRENPTIKISEVSKQIGVSGTVIRRVRKENNLEHLGYMHLIGNNNQKYKLQENKDVTTYR
ncbi:MAG: hypothetical protein Q8L34_00925, partial [Candidatus Woesearchaeota archaeon]|nr:hypothetical protein [Candidatus Woesearchaeota archaeon]